MINLEEKFRKLIEEFEKEHEIKIRKEAQKELLEELEETIKGAREMNLKEKPSLAFGKLFYKKEEDVKEAVLDFHKLVETLRKENSSTGMSDKEKEETIRIFEKYDIKPLPIGTNRCFQILYYHRKIFGEWKDD